MGGRFDFVVHGGWNWFSEVAVVTGWQPVLRGSQAGSLVYRGA